MLNLLKALRQDEHGVILSAEIVIVGTVLVLGVLTGLTCLQKSVNSELVDLANAIDSIDQSYSWSGHRMNCLNGRSGGCSAYTAGSSFHNNECNPNACQHDIVGCQDQVILHSGNRGTGCGTCGSCGAQCSTTGACGSCGATGLGCGVPNRPNCVSTGVPKMRVSEYPGMDNVPRTSNAGRSPIRFPELEAVPQRHEFIYESQQSYPVPGQILEHQVPRHEGVLPETIEPNDSIAPIPQNQPYPPTPVMT
ncbi:MAG TPA: hypothetical protein PK992_10060 [Planctomycetaceae bacterium]|nr:hypothetical protein [Planctomycetaceae bacterium]